ncbi:MAG: heat-inducible transcriptional repressor HrcA [Desulfurella sp.]|uniref:Heat-inducible transcription repressor HrcA n=1 Tax=Desulfurella multipotens TaxID=79269 RepID=A0A1G6QGP0_9BACT|nr:heat-inducible transcriptional repressor HrcA [Desulfurella multipotens]SDC90847.1 heat-inducible transcription repressor HrcA [Desulfurella multipotens]
MKAELDERYLTVLNIVVENFINYKEAVGSRVLIKRYNLPFSAATMRNIMSDLEEMGYLKHSYISSGKIPTELGYKVYVQHLLEKKRKSLKPRLKQIDNINLSTIEDFVSDISNILSNSCGLISMVSSPNIFKLKLKDISLIKIGSNKLLCAVIAEPSVVETKIIEVAKDYSESELNDIVQFLSENYKGWELEKIQEDLENSLSKSRQECDLIFKKLKEKSKALYFSGVQNLLKEREFYEDYEQLNKILDVIEKRKHVSEIVDLILKNDEKILIGNDIPNEKLKGMSLIAQPYYLDNVKLGFVGVLGPMNLNYENVIYTLDLLSKKIEKLFKQGR